MEKLKRFNQTNKKNIVPLVALCVIVAVVSAAISYAVYQKEDEVLFINAKVGNFETTNSDIELAMTLDGNDIDIPPNKSDGYYNVTIECDHADGRWDEEEWGAVITNISSNRVKCNVSFETVEIRSLSVVDIGDYISMNPTATSYKIPTDQTGVSINQTLNPSELNLWRVIKKNEDGTVDAVSEYVSSTDIRCTGETIFAYYVNLLENIASQYTNELYVQSTRNVGYNGQVLICPAIDELSCPSEELYKQDVDLIALALNTLKAKDINTNEYEKYMLSSRAWIGGSGSLRGVTKEGVVSEQWEAGWILPDISINLRVRPIITLKSTTEIVRGDGKSASSAYQLS